MTDDALSEFRVAQVSVQASRSEGVPMTILEASSVGTPTVAGASSPGVCELLEGDRG
ncbi:glycosyltransferase family 4 protein, partial [Ornithinimicrobium cerasi]|uniref:glycosyltransferase family 4 protein n=1 Tax=Ornithinimicrobium cerasi TaxID=2248773 RepID=UPI00148374C3